MIKINKLIILAIITILIIPLFSSNAMCTTTIGDSTFPADEGDTYTWRMTYCHPNDTDNSGIGSYYNFSIERIYRDSYFPMTHALIVNATIGVYAKGQNTHLTLNIPDYVVYNATMHYLDLNLGKPFIIPIPLNLTMIAENFEDSVLNYTIIGSTLTIYYGSGKSKVYKFNSNGFVTTITDYELGEKYYEFKLSGAKESAIPFGNYYILFSTLTVICVVIAVKKRHILLKK